MSERSHDPFTTFIKAKAEPVVEGGASVVADGEKKERKKREKKEKKPGLIKRDCLLQVTVQRRTERLLYAAMADKNAKGLRGRAVSRTACLEEAVEKTFGHLVPVEQEAS